MQLFIRSQELHTVEVSGNETVGDIKAHVAAAEGLTLEDLAVYYAGQPLENDIVLTSCAGDLATLEVDVRMLGGKVHGSLARAGKVKGQTPKVDKQEKKKKKTGRAKRRMQYNRRFVNVVATFGRKKGPNSNS
uniref:Ribosomal protein rps30 n=1 Tax=Arenicola marina TaxID=6344 RepID=A8UEU5_AREMA|nr:ribosomal protein rps30 [Arenicola marina]